MSPKGILNTLKRREVVKLKTIEERAQALHPLAEDAEGHWSEIQCGPHAVPVWRREFWTSQQRQAHNLHEISYRACYKPQLPALFIEHFTQKGDRIYDPFSGRGTTAVEAALKGRQVSANDINPLSEYLAKPRLTPPSMPELKARLAQIPKAGAEHDGLDLSMFFHPQTDEEIRAMRAYFIERQAKGELDELDAWIRMVATNRLTGHSVGFFSVYTLPPNQAASAKKQVEINAKRNQSPTYRDTHELILKKSSQLTKTLTDIERDHLLTSSKTAKFLTSHAAETIEIEPESIQLTVTSPPFLDVVQYKLDNWMRCWFCGLDAQEIGSRITMEGTLKGWSRVMSGVLTELHRITKKGGYVAFEVGEVRGGKIRLDEHILPLGVDAGFEPLGIVINEQDFTKTANIWGVDNNAKGTNTNRIVLFNK